MTARDYHPMYRVYYDCYWVLVRVCLQYRIPTHVCENSSGGDDPTKQRPRHSLARGPAICTCEQVVGLHTRPYQKPKKGRATLTNLIPPHCIGEGIFNIGPESPDSLSAFRSWADSLHRLARYHNITKFVYQPV